MWLGAATLCASLICTSSSALRALEEWHQAAQAVHNRTGAADCAQRVHSPIPGLGLVQRSLLTSLTSQLAAGGRLKRTSHEAAQWQQSSRKIATALQSQRRTRRVNRSPTTQR